MAIDQNEEIKNAVKALHSKGQKLIPAEIAATLGERGVLVSVPHVRMVVRELGLTPQESDGAATATQDGTIGKAITKEIARTYQKDPSGIDLNTFAELDNEAAEILSKTDGWLSLNGLHMITDEVAQRLARFKGRRLELAGLHAMSDAAAAALASLKADLEIGVSELTDNAAESLSSFANKLILSGICSLSTSAASSLEAIDREGRLDVAAEFCKTIAGLKDLCPGWNGLLRFRGWRLSKKKLKWSDLPEKASHLLHQALNPQIDTGRVKLTKVNVTPPSGSQAEEYFVARFDDDANDFHAAYVSNLDQIVAEDEN